VARAYILLWSRGGEAEMAMDQHIQDMCLLASMRHLGGLAIVSFLALVLALPAVAQTNSDSETQGADTAGVRATFESERGPTSSNPVTQKTDSSTVTPTGTSNPGTKKAGSAVLINIDKTKQKMAIVLGGLEKYEWPISTGRTGYSTPSGTYTATSMNEIWYSKQWDNAPMPHSIFFIKDGHAIHGSYDLKNLGKPVSHGCVRISPENAAKLYALVEEGLENTKVVLTGVTPGGESKVASPAGRRSRYGQTGPGWYKPGDNYYTQPETRPGLFGRSFGSLLQPSSGLLRTTAGLLRAARILRTERPISRPENACRKGTAGRAQAPERQPSSMVLFPTVEPPSVLDPCGSRTASRSITGPRFVQSLLMLSSNSSSEALIFSTSRSKLSLRTSSTPLG
jgi:lipoprotein-anchoring transpeptidase ErfK/SrfK